MGTKKTTCPDNPLAQLKDFINHPLAMKQQKYIRYKDKYIAPINGILTLSNEPFVWLFDRNDSSVANADRTFRWDANGRPEVNKQLILWKCRQNPNQTSFTFEPNGDLRFDGYCVTVKTNCVVFGNKDDISIKVYPIYSMNIKFVSYNILTGLPEYENDFKSYISKKLRTWGLGREDLVRTEILKADIAIVVECTKAQLKDILHETDKFEAHIEYKIGENDGTAILFNKLRFELVKKEATQLHPKGSKYHGGQIVFNVALFDHQTQKMLCVTGLHLKSRDEHEYEMRRLVELTSALKITDKFIKEYGNIPQVLSGDLNSDLYNPENRVASSLKKDGYTNVGDTDDRPTYYFFQESIYDYIFIKGAITASSYDVDDVKGTRCPNAEQGSDHLAIRCNLIL